MAQFEGEVGGDGGERVEEEMQQAEGCCEVLSFAGQSSCKMGLVLTDAFTRQTSVYGNLSKTIKVRSIFSSLPRGERSAPSGEIEFNILVSVYLQNGYYKLPQPVCVFFSLFFFFSSLLLLLHPRCTVNPRR